MTLELLTLSLATAAAVSIVVSAVVYALWPVLLGAFQRLTPAAESRALLALASLPLFASVLVLAACFLPSLGLATDHCVYHGLHHPHLCLHHLPHVAPTLAVLAMAGFIVVCATHASYGVARGLYRSVTTERTLCQAAAPGAHGVRVLPKEQPDAFVIGLLRPKLFASRGLLSMSQDVQDIVLAHERAHIHRRDPLRQLVATAFLGFHLPGIAGIIRRRLQAASEMAADAHAADTFGDGSYVADVLVKLTRAHHTHPVPAFGFVGDLEVRVRRLLAPKGRELLGPTTLIAIVGAATLSAIAFAEPLHHAVETFLGQIG
jgi:Zn-dependent protease with chaperone function